mmetsp:Transcript_19734/g.35757  ORF Transcript_19734/g.35757 Transcript_19734/m.35757 type:complete len:345 (-) Transcript_19734:80-1114(-)
MEHGLEEEIPIGRYTEVSSSRRDDFSMETAGGEPVEEIQPQDLVMGPTVGAGASAEVYRATWKGQAVAVKMFWNLMPRSHKEMMVLNREVRILAQAQHPNLAQLYGVVIAHGQPLRIVTDFCEGGSLAGLIYDEPTWSLTWDQKLQVCADTASGMVYLHKQRIIHRDLKSPNLLLNKSIKSVADVPHCKISDFGLAKMRTEPTMSAMTMAVGTLTWMAPEMFVSPFYNEKVDVYSFSLVLFEVICEEQPFEDVDPNNLQKIVRKGQRPDMEAVPPDCPKQLSDLMVEGWAGEPNDRPPFTYILDVLLKLEPDPARPLDGHTRAPRAIMPVDDRVRKPRRRYMSL